MLTAQLTNGNAVCTALRASLADLGTTVAKRALLTEAKPVGCTVKAHTAIRAVDIAVAQLAVALAFGTDRYALGASLPAGKAEIGTFAAKQAGLAELFRTFLTRTAIRAIITVVAQLAVACAIGTDRYALGASLAAGKAEIGTFAAKQAGLAEAYGACGTVKAHSAIGTACIPIAFGAISKALGADVCALGAGRTAIGTKLHAISAKVTVFTVATGRRRTVIAESALAAGASRTLGTVKAYIALGTERTASRAAFAAIFAEGCTVLASASADAYPNAVSAASALIAPAAVTYAVLAGITVAAEIVIAVVTVLAAIGAYQ